jgi:hypothetical protein
VPLARRDHGEVAPVELLRKAATAASTAWGSSAVHSASVEWPVWSMRMSRLMAASYAPPPGRRASWRGRCPSADTRCEAADRRGCDAPAAGHAPRRMSFLFEYSGFPRRPRPGRSRPVPPLPGAAGRGGRPARVGRRGRARPRRRPRGPRGRARRAARPDDPRS